MDIQSLLVQLKRHTQISTSAAFQAGKWASWALKDKAFSWGDPAEVHEERAQELSELLGGFKGPLMKVAQLLSMVPGLLPEPYARALAKLSSQAPAMGPFFVKRRLRSELGDAWENNFSSFSLQASYAASLGQVHEAQGLGGGRLAVKIQYPNLPSIFLADFDHLSRLLKGLGRHYGSLDLTKALEEIKERLWEEMDYGREAQNMLVFQQLFGASSCVSVPKPVVSLSTSRLLTMEYREGQPLEEACKLPQDLRDELGARLLESWFKPFFSKGILHGDPHPGNFSFSWDGQVILYDFGCMRQFQPSFVEGARLLYQGLLQDHNPKIKEALGLLGFRETDPEILGLFTQWARYLFAPFLVRCRGPLDQFYKAQDGKAIAGNILKGLKEKGGVVLPPELVLLDRAAVGIGSACIRLQSHADWYEIMHHLMGF